MHEIVKYFILTEIQKQCLNPMPEPLIGPGRPAEQLPACLALLRQAGWGNGAYCPVVASTTPGLGSNAHRAAVLNNVTGPGDQWR